MNYGNSSRLKVENELIKALLTYTELPLNLPRVRLVARKREP